METITPTNADSLLAQARQISAQTAQQGLQTFAGSSFDTAPKPPTTPVNTTLNAGAIGTPKLNVTQPVTATGYSALNGMIQNNLVTNATEAQAQAETKALLAKSTEAQTTKDTAQQSLIDKLLGRKGEATLEAEAYANNGADSVNQTELDLKDINNQILSEQVSNRHALEALDKNSQGMYGGALESQKNALNKESLSKQADLSVIQMAKQGRYDSAKTIADRLVKAQTEEQQNKIDAANLTYQDAKDTFTKAEQRAFETMQGDRQRALDLQKETAKTLQDTKLEALKMANQNGAPLSVLTAIQTATTPEGVLSSAGKYGGDILGRQIQQAQINKLNAEARKEVLGNGGIVGSSGKLIPNSTDTRKINKELVESDAYKAVKKGQDSLAFLKNFEDTFKKTGATSAVFSPRQNADLKAKYNASILNLKEFFNLGVLNGPDEAILRGVLPDPTNKSAALTVGSFGIYKPATATRAGIENLKTMIEKSLDDRYESLSTQYSDYDPSSVKSVGDLNRIYVQQKSSLNPQIQQLIKDNPNLTYEDVISVILNK